MIFILDNNKGPDGQNLKLGHGSMGTVYKASLQSPEGPGPQIYAVKKSRVSLRVKRPGLEHEARMLQLVRGHSAIPVLYGYGRFKYFEYIAMERLGSSLKDLHRHPQGLPLKTVLLIADQMLSALEYIHGLSVVHRDIKPHNILVSLTEPNTVCVIDFGISRHCPTGPPAQRDPEVEKRHIMGTVDWASLNAHRGFELLPRDDLESLAYTLLYLLAGDVPWRAEGAVTDRYDILRCMKEVRRCKEEYSGATLAPAAYPEFGQLLDYARGLGWDESVDYARFRALSRDLRVRCGLDQDDVLDWTPCDPPSPPLRDSHIHPAQLPIIEPTSLPSSDSSADTVFSSSYYADDYEAWDDRQGNRDRSLTFPAEEREELDHEIPRITEIVLSRKVRFWG